MTSLEVIETGEVVEQMSKVEAERITARIADKLDGIADNIEQVMPLIREALTRKAWEPLGYTGATAYVSERFAGAFQRLPAAVRRPIVAELSSAGMSTRAIAPIVGVTHKTVVKDSQATREVVPEVPPAPEPHVNRETGEIHEPTVDYQAEAAKIISSVAKAEPQKITGMDGKTYSRPEPPKPRAEAVTKQFTSAVADLNRILDKFHRITASQNFQANKNQVATLHGNDLARAISELESIADQLT